MVRELASDFRRGAWEGHARPVSPRGSPARRARAPAPLRFRSVSGGTRVEPPEGGWAASDARANWKKKSGGERRHATLEARCAHTGLLRAATRGRGVGEG